jgi:hypothetical protein
MISCMNTSPIQRSLFPQLDAPTQETVIATLDPHLSLLREAIMEPWRDFQNRRGEDRYFTDLAEDEAAQWLTMQATHRIKAVFHGMSGFRILSRHGKSILLLEDKLAITVKKMTRRRNGKGSREEITRSNYPTRRNQFYWDQRRSNDEPDVPRVILGYMLFKEVTDIQILIAYPRTMKRGVEWSWRLPEVAVPATESFVPRIAAGTEEDVPDRGYSISAIEQSSEGSGVE